MEKLASARKVNTNGYATVIDWFGLLGEKGKRVPEHRLIASLVLGRPLEEGEMVHHLDLDRSNNTPDNLVVVNAAEHGRFHRNGNRTIRKKATRQVSFEGTTKYVKMKCPWCGKVFYKRRSESVLARDNKLHVNCCSSSCNARLSNAVEKGECSDLAKRVRDNIICEFSSNGAFMDRFVKGRYPSSWFIDDAGVFHCD